MVMTMRIFASLVISLILCGAAFAQRVERYNVGALTDNRVVYALPLTKLYLEVETEMVVEEPGELALYAERFLGTKHAIIDSATRYVIKGIKLGAYGVADTSQRYSVDFKKNSTATNVALTESGILVGINNDKAEVDQIPAAKSPIMYAPEEWASSMLPPEYIQATTIATKAKILAEEIYRTRESRNLVISGESEQPFADGQALKLAVERLDQRERTFVELFNGTVRSSIGTHVLTEVSAIDEGRRVVARFSDMMGLLPADDLRGEPIYLDLQILDRAPVLEEKEEAKLQKRLEKGIVYRVPGMVRATVTFRGQKLVSQEVPVAQLGSLEALDMVLFTTKGKSALVELYSANGGLKEVKEINQSDR